MKNRTVAIYLTVCFCMFLFTVSLSAQTDTARAVETSINLDLASRYIWRGMELADGLSIQPGFSATWKGFTLGAWGAYNLTGDGDQETDLYLSKTVGFVTISLWDYWGFNRSSGFDLFDYSNATTSHLLEAQIILSGGETLPFNFVASNLFYGADPSRSVYLELQFVPKFNVADLVVFAGYQVKGEYYAPNQAFVNLGCTLKKSIVLTDRFSIPMTLSMIVNPANKSAWLVAGISL